MQGLMQDRQLLISTLIEYAGLNHSNVEIVSQTCEGVEVRSNYANLRSRSKKLAKALLALGINTGDRVGTLAWNTFRHQELYFAVPGMGAVLHTINPRLFADQIEYIIQHAEDTVLFFDISFTALLLPLLSKLTHVQAFIAMTDREHLPAEIPDCLCYEDLLNAQDDVYDWPQFQETQAASLCYTSGTTGQPKGVLYSHRSTVLHAFTVCTVDGLQLSRQDSVLLVVPMFHVNAWGFPYAAAMCGAKLCLPGLGLDGESICELANNEQCTMSIGVPTVWLGFMNYLESAPDRAKTLKLNRIVMGGSAAPRALIDRIHTHLGAKTIHAWGMTETSPMGTIGNLLPEHQHLSQQQKFDLQAKQGRVIYGVEIRIVDDEGKILARDGIVAGHLQVRGPWIANAYFKMPDHDVLDKDGWFSTGDIACISAQGYLQITDRSKDVIKSGGEWISSIDLENTAVAHPAILEAAVVGLHHSKWQERPLLVAIKRPDTEVTQDELKDFLACHVAKWWLPDDIVFVDSLPHTATGKLQKNVLREQFKDFVFSTDQ
ncbi:long-chain-fatty-acid--CoA ligase [Acinetobacter qingfengensis]|uniref:Long-chain fatty acid--CoA ligase n=1 Tax=Acinetobacter qingfengensis TaxID=1262585 RepID=A0A1E7RCJ5_9GAMM|nr:long-chain-fatty-acid--CoA ligase [Acinetobacter qingfengensis]KAA8735069.1 long-chain-fatty-acid--CoA ligase [Acinetobacter qingfengensis]OEY97013.1 long-chain fatty acid--CoA ligase [Acinetobacter qingfengensis]